MPWPRPHLNLHVLVCAFYAYTLCLQANLQLVVNIARDYTEQLGADKIIAMLESYNSYPGLYLYLGSRIATT